MDMFSKDGFPSQQNHAPRGSLPFAIPVVPQPPQPGLRMPMLKKVRPSTGRLISPAQERGVTLRGRITRVIASCCIARLVVLASEDPHHPIVIHIDSPGGSRAEAMSILSTIKGIRCPVVTFCRGEVYGPAAIVASYGLRGYRAAAPDCRFSLRITNLHAGERRQGATAEPLLPLLTEILVKNTRQRQEEVVSQLTSGTPFGVQEALRIGLIDTIADEPVFPK